MITWAQAIWAAARTFDKVLLVALTAFGIFDLVRLNVLDFLVAVAVVAWVVYDIHEETLNGRD